MGAAAHEAVQMERRCRWGNASQLLGGHVDLIRIVLVSQLSQAERLIAIFQPIIPR